MTNIIIAIAAVLLLVIFILIFRVQTLLSVLRGSDSSPKGGMHNKLNGTLFLLFLVFGLGAFYYYTLTMDYNLPEAASVHGKITDNLFLVSMIIIIIAFTITQILLLGFAFLYQKKEGVKAKFYPENSMLEFFWTIVPAIVLTLLIWQGWKAWSEITTIPTKENDKNRIELEVLGQQFYWKVRYPGLDGEFGKHNFRLIDEINQFGMDFNDKNSFDDFTPTEIHLPKGYNVLFRIRAKDVLHSVYAPHFRLKMDAVPGMPTSFYFTPTKTTQEMRNELGNQEFNYEVACAEMCGRGHFGMRYIIVVEEYEDFVKWYADQAPWSELNTEYVESKISDEKLAEFQNWLGSDKTVSESSFALN